MIKAYNHGQIIGIGDQVAYVHKNRFIVAKVVDIEQSGSTSYFHLDNSLTIMEDYLVRTDQGWEL
jgi:hypothetical protein